MTSFSPQICPSLGHILSLGIPYKIFYVGTGRFGALASGLWRASQLQNNLWKQKRPLLLLPCSPFCPLPIPWVLILNTLASKLPAHRSLSLSLSLRGCYIHQKTQLKALVSWEPLLSSWVLQTYHILFPPQGLWTCSSIGLDCTCTVTASMSSVYVSPPGREVFSNRNH